MTGPGPPSLRDDLDALVEAALEAVDPADLVRRALDEDPFSSGPPLIVAVGKAARPMSRGALSALDGTVRGGVVLAPENGDGAEDLEARGLRIFRGGHPLPTARGVEGARAVRAAAEEAAGRTAPVLLLLSGGGSALLTIPAGDLQLDDLRATTGLLMEAGADIGALNTVRKHLETLKGGRLAELVAPAPLRALVLSDVVGDRMDVIASGPVSPDPTTFGDALRVLREAGVADRVPGAVIRHLEAGREGRVSETPGPGAPCFDLVRTRIVGNVETAARGAMEAAAARGYRTRLLSTTLTGEAREVGRRLGRLARRTREGDGPVAPPACLVAGGETTVTVTGDGKGGRNQEVALGAALEIRGVEDVLVASVGTDGVDGPTDAAGARADGTTVERARARGLEPADALERNDAHPFFRALDDLLVTGPTGTNVMDVQLVLVRPASGP